MSLMTNHTKVISESAEMMVPTQQDCWVIPKNCDFMKLLVEQQALCASDLRFRSPEQSHYFIRQLFLLALQDEYQTDAPSPLAQFARAAMKTIQNPTKQNHD